MRLAKLKRFYLDEKTKKWVPKEKNRHCYVIPTNVYLLENFTKDGKEEVFIVIKASGEECIHLNMTLDEALKEINDALNHKPECICQGINKKG